MIPVARSYSITSVSSGGVSAAASCLPYSSRSRLHLPCALLWWQRACPSAVLAIPFGVLRWLASDGPLPRDAWVSRCAQPRSRAFHPVRARRGDAHPVNALRSFRTVLRPSSWLDSENVFLPFFPPDLCQTSLPVAGRLPLTHEVTLLHAACRDAAVGPVYMDVRRPFALDARHFVVIVKPLREIVRLADVNGTVSPRRRLPGENVISRYGIERRADCVDVVAILAPGQPVPVNRSSLGCCCHIELIHSGTLNPAVAGSESKNIVMQA